MGEMVVGREEGSKEEREGGRKRGGEGERLGEWEEWCVCDRMREGVSALEAVCVCVCMCVYVCVCLSLLVQAHVAGGVDMFHFFF